MCGTMCWLFVVTFMLGRAHRATLQTIIWGGWHCRVPSLSTFSVEKAFEQGRRRLRQAHELGLVALFLKRHSER